MIIEGLPNLLLFKDGRVEKSNSAGKKKKKKKKKNWEYLVIFKIICMLGNMNGFLKIVKKKKKIKKNE